MMRAWGIGFVALMMAGSAQAADWKPLDADNTLVVDTSKGRVIIALSPEMAPQAVERIKTLTRRGFYDGLLFHRVIPQFVAQTGNPNNKDGGKSDLPNLALEAVFNLKTTQYHTVARPVTGTVGFVGATPFASTNDYHIKTGAVRAWGTHCAGVVGMGRDDEPKNSANSELYITLSDVSRLDRDYTVVGRVVSGFEVVKALNTGEPPSAPDAMQKVRIMADMTAAEQPKLEIMDTDGAAFKAHVTAIRAERGADFSVCDIAVPVRAR
ncbi:peptidylprolyl isomerase [Asticcacaulis machinosus]|uniref:peptidylprolyl isomerase n=1 Tax=Asticcacaulis machinosus TaxID=2984211 RepID=A0ABT5HMC1_9CAUL|nr:peptidylprolyl isomerase [Asticcacaulis machinosus]MDC7677322.1 peptidylprolyl isomerase [Asticcacaulis machinosus]